MAVTHKPFRAIAWLHSAPPHWDDVTNCAAVSWHTRGGHVITHSPAGQPPDKELPLGLCPLRNSHFTLPTCYIVVRLVHHSFGGIIAHKTYKTKPSRVSTVVFLYLKWGIYSFIVTVHCTRNLGCTDITCTDIHFLAEKKTCTVSDITNMITRAMHAVLSLSSSKIFFSGSLQNSPIFNRNHCCFLGGNWLTNSYTNLFGATPKKK